MQCLSFYPPTTSCFLRPPSCIFSNTPQGRQRKCEDYTFHLALGPQLFAPFDDTSRAFLACVLDGHGGVGAVQYVAERFPALLLEDLPRLR